MLCLLHLLLKQACLKAGATDATRTSTTRNKVKVQTLLPCHCGTKHKLHEHAAIKQLGVQGLVWLQPNTY